MGTPAPLSPAPGPGSPFLARRVRRLTVAALVLVVGTGAALRLYGLDFGRGVPVARPDEGGTLAGLTVGYRDPLAPFLLLYGGGFFLPLKGYLWLAGDWLDLVPAARQCSAVLSSLTILVVYAAGCRLRDTPTGLLAAAIVAASTLAVREAHFAKPDSAATFAAAVLMLALAHPARSPAAQAIGLGAIGALVVSTKLCVGFMPSVALALARPAPRGFDTRALALGGATFVAVLIALNPFLFLASPATLWTVARAIHGWVGSADWLPGHDIVSGPLLYHGRVSLRFGCGAAFAALALPAIGLALARPQAPRWIAVAVLGYWATLCASSMVLGRFFLPSLPGLALLVAYLVVTTIDRLPVDARARGAGIVALGVLIVAEPLGNAVTLARLLARDDTRALAAQWIATNVAADARIVSWGAPTIWTDYGAPDFGGRHAATRLPPKDWAAQGIDLVVQHEYPLPYSSVPLPALAGLSRLVAFDPFDGPPDDPVLEPLDAFYLPLARFRGVARPGPRITLWAVTR